MCGEHTCQVSDLKIREIFRRPPRAVYPPRPSSSIPYILRQVYKKAKITTCQPETEATSLPFKNGSSDYVSKVAKKKTKVAKKKRPKVAEKMP